MKENKGVTPSSEETELKKKMIRILLIFLGGMLLLLALIPIIGLFSSHGGDGEDPSVYHYPPFEGNIFSYEPYLALDRTVSYCADPSGYGATVSITKENRVDFDAYVLFLCDFLKTMNYGDTEAYNACFSEEYLKEHGEAAAFPPQMIYRSCIYFQSRENDGRDILLHYRLDYMIHRNDGSLRGDVGSDAIRPQYVTLRVREDGSIRIDELYIKKSITSRS